MRERRPEGTSGLDTRGEHGEGSGRREDRVLDHRRQRQSERQSFRSSEALSQQKKARKAGRPKLPKGEAKGRIVPVRFTVDALKAMTAAAKASKQTLSGWIRSTIHAAIQG